MKEHGIEIKAFSLAARRCEFLNRDLAKLPNLLDQLIFLKGVEVWCESILEDYLEKYPEGACEFAAAAEEVEAAFKKRIRMFQGVSPIDDDNGDH